MQYALTQEKNKLNFRAMELGTKIQVNKGEIETLIKIERPFGLFRGESGYQVVRSLIRITDKDMVKNVEKDNN